MPQFEIQWRKLVTLARQPTAGGEVTVPLGFATRVVARVMALPVASPWTGLEQYALRGLAVAVAIGVAAIIFDYPVGATDLTDDIAEFDPVGEILDLN